MQRQTTVSGSQLRLESKRRKEEVHEETRRWISFNVVLRRTETADRFDVWINARTTQGINVSTFLRNKGEQKSPRIRG